MTAFSDPPAVESRGQSLHSCVCFFEDASVRLCASLWAMPKHPRTTVHQLWNERLMKLQDMSCVPCQL